jgi:AcrR family transcriptional regulator
VAESQRWRLLAAIGEELAESGRAGTTSSRVARRAGVSPATFYAHYENISSCLLAAHEAVAESVYEIFERSCDEPQVSWLRRLEDGLGRTLRFLAAEPALGHLLGTGATAGEPEVAVARSRTIGRLAAMLRTGRGLRSGEDPPLPAGTEQLLVGAALATIEDRLAAGDSASLPRLTPALVGMLAGPFT